MKRVWENISPGLPPLLSVGGLLVIYDPLEPVENGVCPVIFLEFGFIPWTRFSKIKICKHTHQSDPSAPCGRTESELPGGSRQCLQKQGGNCVCWAPWCCLWGCRDLRSGLIVWVLGLHKQNRTVHSLNDKVDFLHFLSANNTLLRKDLHSVNLDDFWQIYIYVIITPIKLQNFPVNSAAPPSPWKQSLLWFPSMKVIFSAFEGHVNGITWYALLSLVTDFFSFSVMFLIFILADTSNSPFSLLGGILFCEYATAQPSSC